MSKAYQGRTEGFNAGLNGETFASRRGEPADYRIAFAYGYCEGTELRTRLNWIK